MENSAGRSAEEEELDDEELFEEVSLETMDEELLEEFEALDEELLEELGVLLEDELLDELLAELDEEALVLLTVELVEDDEAVELVEEEVCVDVLKEDELDESTESSFGALEDFPLEEQEAKRANEDRRNRGLNKERFIWITGISIMSRIKNDLKTKSKESNRPFCA